jgi:hypothetical protein
LDLSQRSPLSLSLPPWRCSRLIFSADPFDFNENVGRENLKIFTWSKQGGNAGGLTLCIFELKGPFKCSAPKLLTSDGGFERDARAICWRCNRHAKCAFPMNLNLKKSEIVESKQVEGWKKNERDKRNRRGGN